MRIASNDEQNEDNGRGLKNIKIFILHQIKLIMKEVCVKLNNNLNRKNVLLSLILVILISLVPPLTLTIQQREDPFWFIYQIPLILSNFQEGHLFERNVLGHEVMIMLISKVLGLSPDDIIFFPISGFIAPILFYVVVKRVFKSHLLALLCIPYMAFFISGSHSYAISPLGLGFCIFLTSLFFYINILNRIEKIIILLLTFVALHFIYYTAEVFLLLFLVYSTIILIFEERICNKKLQSGYLIPNLVLAFIVIFFAFNHMLYKTFVPELFKEKSFESAITPILSALFSSGRIAEQYVYVSPKHEINFWILLIWIAIIAAPIILSLFSTLIKSVVGKRRELWNYSDIFTTFKWAIILLIVSEILIYSIRGTLMFRILFLLGPIVAIASLQQVWKKNWEKISVILLVALILVSSVYFNLNYSNQKLNKLEGVESSISWLYQNRVQDQISILTDDLYTLGDYRTAGVKWNIHVHTECINHRRYGYIVDPVYVYNKSQHLKQFYDYIVMNKKHANTPLYGFEWVMYEPLSIYFHEINNNVNINKIYDDDIVWIFKTR